MISDADRDELGELLTLIERTLLAGGRVAFPDQFAAFESAVTSLVTRDFEHIRNWLARRLEDPDVEQRLTSAGLLGAELRFKRVALELYVPRAPAPLEPPSEKRNTRGLELASDAVKTIGLSLVKAFGLGSAFKEIVELLQTGFKALIGHIDDDVAWRRFVTPRRRLPNVVEWIRRRFTRPP